MAEATDQARRRVDARDRPTGGSLASHSGSEENISTCAEGVPVIKTKDPLPRLMIINLNGEDPLRLVRRYLDVATAKLGFDVDTVWCSQAEFEGLRESLTGIKVIATSYCPPGYFQLGKRQKGGETDAG